MNARDLLAAATPRPWETDPAFVCEIGRPGSEGSEGEWDARIAKTEDPDDAALIVVAVNEYEALLDIAETARAYLYGLATENGDGLADALDRLDAIRAPELSPDKTQGHPHSQEERAGSPDKEGR